MTTTSLWRLHTFPAVLLAFATLVHARQDQVPPAASASAKQAESLAELLEPLRAQFNVPALGAAVVAGADVIALGAVGERERGLGVAVTVDDRWHLGSCTKAMTATVAARLVERGKIQWSTTLAEAFPDLKQTMHADWRACTLEWLLQNRGGAPGNPPRELWGALWQRTDSPHAARAWFVGELLKAPPEVQPGTKFTYSNQGFTIAGAMLERAAKKTWEELMRAELFEPLGMQSAGFGAPGSVDAVDQPRGHTGQPIIPGPGADNPAAIGPAGTVHCSLSDWARFASAHLRGARGVDGLLSAKVFERLHTPPPDQDYAMGWGRSARDWAGGDVLTHAGSNTMWYCVVWIAPAKDRAFLVTTNWASDDARKAADATLRALVERYAPK